MNELVRQIFQALKEKQMVIINVISESIIEQVKSWKSIKLFNGHYEIYTNEDMIVIVDRIGNRFYFVKDSEGEIVKFMKKVEDYIFNVLPNSYVPTGIEELKFKIEGYERYEFSARVYNDELRISPYEVNKKIRSFLFDNYIVKRKEDIIPSEKRMWISILREGNVMYIKGDTEEISDFLQRLGFQFDKEQGVWKKEVSESEVKTIVDIIQAVEKI